MKSYPLTGRKYLPSSLTTVIDKVAEKVASDNAPEPETADPKPSRKKQPGKK